MKSSDTSSRLKEIMKMHNYRQVDILEKCKPYCKKFGVKLGRNDLSQYVNGKVEPRQDKLTILGLALGVNEAWLMGYDVQMDRKHLSSEEAKSDFSLIEKFSLLSERDKIIVINLIDSLIQRSED